MAGVQYARALVPPGRDLPRILDGFGVWNRVVACLMPFAYAYPLLQVWLRIGGSIHPDTAFLRIGLLCVFALAAYLSPSASLSTP